MLASAVIAAVGLGLAGISGCQQAQVRSLAPPADLSAAGLTQLWSYRIPLASNEMIADVWRVGDSVYVSTDQARLIRLEAASGAWAWEANLETASYKIFRPADAPDGKHVLVVNLGKAFLLDKQSGGIVKQHTLDFAATTNPIVAGGNTFCLGGLNYFHAMFLDQLSGDLWRIPAKNDTFTAQPVVEDDSVVLATETGILWRVKLSDGQWIWRDHKTNGRVVGGLAADAAAFYVPCLDGNVYGFDMSRGANLWITPLKGELNKNLVATRGEVLVPTQDGILYALGTAHGDITWKVPGIRYIGTLAGDRVWVLNSAGDVEALAMDDGHVLMSAPAGGGYIVSNTVDQMVITVSKAGVVAEYSAGK
jgi:outer membrane protein assembly factor BamB